jgi:hypothetical protein
MAIQQSLNIKLPDTHRFQYGGGDYSAAGKTPWFHEADWGNVFVYELAFERYGYSPCDVAGIMIHEATHAWQQYSLEKMTTDPRYSDFRQDPKNVYVDPVANGLFWLYRQKEWQEEFGPLLEIQAYDSMLAANTSGRIQISDTLERDINRNKDTAEELAKNLFIPGTNLRAVPLDWGSP